MPQPIRNSLEPKKKYGWLLILWLLFVTVLSLIKIGKIPAISVENSDKYVHFIFYFITAFLTYITLKQFGVSFYKRVLFSFVFSVVYGIIIEVLQEVVTDTRRFEWADILANASGALISLLLISVLRSKVNFLK